MFCRNCGSNIDDKAVICPHCGVPTANMQPPVPPRKTNVCAIVGFVLGLTGLLGANLLFILPGIAGIVLSIIGLVKVKNLNSGTGLATAGLVISIISIPIYLYSFIVAFIDIAQNGLGVI